MDILRDEGAIFLGSRLKRLGERMQAGAARMIADAGLPMQPTHMPLLAALDGRSMTLGELVRAVGVSQPGVTRAVGQLVEMGLVQSATGDDDQRRRAISLTPAGAAAMARARLHVWPRLVAAVEEVCDGTATDLIARLARIEDAIADAALDVRGARVAAADDLLTIHDYRDDLAPHFHDINAAWITAMYRLEDTDREVLSDPRGRIVDPGGAVLFVEARGLGIVGTCALQRTGGDAMELTKMGVREDARGLKAGEFLLRATIDRAKAMGADPLYLLTNSRAEAAIHLYLKNGFAHDADIMARYGARYARCDVAMRYVGIG